MEVQVAAERKRKKQAELEQGNDCDETFAYIAGYTAGGAPYGVTWEEMGEASEQPE